MNELAVRMRDEDKGMSTAEYAVGTVAVCGLVAVVLSLAWLLSLGAAQGTVAHAAREGARAAARGESVVVIRASVHRVAPDAAVTVQRSGNLVTVSASVARVPPLRFLRPLRREVRAEATSWREDV